MILQILSWCNKFKDAKCLDIKELNVFAIVDVSLYVHPG